MVLAPVPTSILCTLRFILSQFQLKWKQFCFSLVSGFSSARVIQLTRWVQINTLITVIKLINPPVGRSFYCTPSSVSSPFFTFAPCLPVNLFSPHAWTSICGPNELSAKTGFPRPVPFRSRPLPLASTCQRTGTLKDLTIPPLTERRNPIRAS